jgi:hypothetical protein
MMTSLSSAVLHYGDCGRGAVHPIKWKAKYGGMDVSEANRLRTLEE